MIKTKLRKIIKNIDKIIATNERLKFDNWKFTNLDLIEINKQLKEVVKND